MLIDLNSWQEVFLMIRRNKLRTFLTSFSMAWGVFMLVVLLGTSKGVENNVRHNFIDDAVNSLWIYPGATSISYKNRAVDREIQFTNEDYEMIHDSIKATDKITSRIRPGIVSLSYKDKQASFDVRATHPDHLYLEKTKIVQGRFINENDMVMNRKIVVIGVPVKNALFGSEDAIGKSIHMGEALYRVVGIFKDDGSERELRKAYIPLSTAQMLHRPDGTIDQVMLTLDPNADSVEIAGDIQRLMARRHQFDEKDTQAIRVRNNKTRFEQVSDVFTWLRLFTWIVAIGTIMAGIIGVGNIMVITVKERTKEIGVRKALGATPSRLVRMVLKESMFVTICSGYIGMMFGVFVLFVVEKMGFGDKFLRDTQVDMNIVTSATLLLIIAGALAGFFPARKIAMVNPIEAMRAE